MPLQALFWDVDGTLAETERDGHRPAFNAAFAEAGVPWHWDEATYRQLLRVAGGRERMRAWASQQPSPPQAFLADGTSFLEGLQRLKQQHYRQRLAAGLIQPRPGVLRLMGEAHERGLRQWIVTTSGRDAVEALLSTSLCRRPTGWSNGSAARTWRARNRIRKPIGRRCGAADLPTAAWWRWRTPATAGVPPAEPTCAAW